jgi:hypothetical protein
MPSASLIDEPKLSGRIVPNTRPAISIVSGSAPARVTVTPPDAAGAMPATPIRSSFGNMIHEPRVRMSAGRWHENPVPRS